MTAIPLHPYHVRAATFQLARLMGYCRLIATTLAKRAMKEASCWEAPEATAQRVVREKTQSATCSGSGSF